MGLLPPGDEGGRATLAEQPQERGADVSVQAVSQSKVPNHGDSILGLRA